MIQNDELLYQMNSYIELRMFQNVFSYFSNIAYINKDKSII